ncbi:uncharacterized protein si:dkeyp-72h1.1 [Melanotaenia boesemani]|uniref:uncharacterized protein si:dkeyp-72h1.1 n=1 Tax=Melanotaenia boesemani TaxID=1250792 RepID=UPI001C058D6C|nr:uncharacterized protein si:dkeyp-72h1.1 [Melanotaenia boesemani]
MTNKAINTCDSGVGGASGEDVGSVQVGPSVISNSSSDWSTPPPVQAFLDSKECFPKLSRHLPSIVVEPMDVGEVESGELRWPPDDVSSDVTEDCQQQTGGSEEGAELQEQLMGGV